MDRRQFIKATALTGTSATLASCGNPEYHLIRFIPEEVLTPGIAVLKPSVCPLCSAGCGLSVRVMEGEAEVIRKNQLGVTKMGLAKKLDIPAPLLYFQAPGGQCLRLVGIDDDLSMYEGAGEGPNVANVKEALAKGAARC